MKTNSLSRYLDGFYEDGRSTAGPERGNPSLAWWVQHRVAGGLSERELNAGTVMIDVLGARTYFTHAVYTEKT